MTTQNSLNNSSIQTTRIPVKYKNIQYNFCKNPKCENFGVEPEEQATRGVLGKYSLFGSLPLLKCNACGEMPPLKSNVGIYEELERISHYLTDYHKPITCPNSNCTNHTVSINTKKAYHKIGKTPQGADRFKCLVCNKTFSIALPTQYQRDTHRNLDIFKVLVNTMPLSRIVKVFELSWETLYNRIDFIHQQCLDFVADREAQLLNMDIKRAYISVDKQDYNINWTERKDKRNIVITAITSCDNETGYVFGIHPNFDSTLDKQQVELDSIIINDTALKSPYRKYARLWLEADYDKSVKKSNNKKNISANLEDDIENKYSELTQREDVESFDGKDKFQQLPNYGFLVHSEYTTIAHFYFLKSLLRNVGKFRFFLDQESGIRSAFMSAFKTDIEYKKAEAFYVSFTKDMIRDDREKKLAERDKRLAELKKQYPKLSEDEIKLVVLKNNIKNVKELGQWQDKWVDHPFPNMGEPEKKMCWLTEHEDFDDDHVAWLYNKASLHGVDSFFQKIRRSIPMLERSIHSSANRGRVWHGYAAYNPAMVVKMVEIFRVVHNYIDVRKERVNVEEVDEKGNKNIVKKTVITTPAMRMGLAKAPLDYKDILYFRK